MSYVLLYCCAAGIIEITNTATSALVGYVSSTYTTATQSHRFGITANPANALSVTVNKGSKQNIVKNNGPDLGTYPFLGFTVGPTSSSNNLATGSTNNILLTSTAVTPPGSPPASVGNAYSGNPSESAVWTADANFFITAQWVNTDSSLPPTFLYYLPNSDGLLATGDPAAFSSSFNGGFTVVFQVV